MGWGKILCESLGKAGSKLLVGDSYCKCPLCHGSKKWKGKKCRSCKGAGRVKINAL